MGTQITTQVPTPSGLQPKSGTLMDIKSTKEEWSEYLLEDGATVKIKQVVTQIIKLDEKDPSGNPFYVTQAQPIVVVIPPPSKG